MERLNTADEGMESAVWTPLTDLALQFDLPENAVVEVLARVDAAAPFAVIETIRARHDPIWKLAHVPFVKLHLKANPDGGTVKAWSND